MHSADFCPLCADCSEKISISYSGRRFFECDSCKLAFVHPEDRVSKEAARSRYLKHTQDPNDPGHREFLSRLLNALSPYIQRTGTGLDYGCGKAKTLCALAKECGFSLEGYDPIFVADESLLQRQFSLITCTETAEHFENPFEEFQLLNRLLLPGGVLGIMTRFIPSSGITNWWYARDITHVSFYRVRTFERIANLLDWRIRLLAADMVIYQKKNGRD